ncbi:hypothetical protein ACET62_20905 [Aeromonas veronii]
MKKILTFARVATSTICILMQGAYLNASQLDSNNDTVLHRLSKTKVATVTVYNKDFPDNVIPDVPANTSLTYRVNLRRESGDNSVYLPDSSRNGDTLRIEAKYATGQGQSQHLYIRGPLYGFEDGVYIHSNEKDFANYGIFKYSEVDKKWKIERLGEPHHQQYGESSSSVSSNISSGALYFKYTIKADASDKFFKFSGGMYSGQVRVVSSEVNNVYLDKENILHASENIELNKGDVILATWDATIGKWTIRSLNKSRFIKSVIRKIEFPELSINTSVSNLPFYNNGRMQKPVDIFYLANLVGSKESVKLNPEEERYYLNISLLGQPSTTLTNLYSKFVVEQQHNPRYTSIGATRRAVARNSQRSRFFIRYIGHESNDVISNLNLCVWSSKSSEDVYDSNEEDCSPSSSSSSIRPISVESGAYQMGQTLEVNRVYENKALCSSWDSCSSLFRTHDNESGDMDQAIANAWVFRSGRNHKFRPLDTFHGQTLAAGCKDSRASVPSTPDGVCYSGGYGDFYATRMTFGYSSLEPIRYTIRDKHHPSFYTGYQEYSFKLPDLDVQNKFAIISVMGRYYNGFHQLVRFTGAGEWAGQTPGSSLFFKRKIEDEYGNRFYFQGNLEEIPGTTFAGDQQKFLGTLRVNDIVVDNIYN